MTNPIESNSEEYRQQQQHPRSPTVKDYLTIEETGVYESIIDDERHGDSATLHCLTPRQIVSKWVKKLRHKKDKVRSPNFNNNDNTPDSHPTVAASKTLISSESGVSGNQEQMTSLKLGAGIGFALVMAASKNELDKMMELRKQMETIVQDAKQELLCKTTTLCNSSATYENGQSYSTTNIEESINSNERVSDLSCVGGSRSSPYIELELDDDDDKVWRSRECNDGRRVLSGMAELESELEAELQLLELQLDSADMSRDNDQDDDVHDSSDGDYETLDGDDGVNYGNEPIDTFAEAHDRSVSPRELERKLHELLETQQLERIKELETVLRHTKKKLLKKEMEACWWKDTAHLITQHVSRTANYNIPKDLTRESFR